MQPKKHLIYGQTLTLKIKSKIGDHQAIEFSLQIEKKETAVEKTNFDFRRRTLMQCVLILMMRFLNVSIINSHAAQRFKFIKTKILESSRSHILKKFFITNNPSWINNDIKQAIARRQRAYDERKRNNTDETSGDYFTSRWLVKRAVTQAKRSKQINVGRLCKTYPKSFYSYITERRIIIDNLGPLKTPTGQIVTTDKDMANTLSTYFSSVFTL